jgi:hypothetical protein
MIHLQCALKPVQNLIAPRALFPFAVKFDPQMKEWAEHSRAPPVTWLLQFLA